MSLTSIWNRLFLEERPTISLSLFRIAVAMTVGLHVIPSFFHLDDNFLSTALKAYNYNFFPPEFVGLIQKSPDGMVLFFVGLFYITWFFFLIGFYSQLNCILMTACCYYFYALNSLHIGTLSWDILIVTLFLMCVTPYHGDYFSIDALRRKNAEAYKKKRPYFLQRLLQMQIASTFFYTALFKFYPHGNWISDNPMYYLLNYPYEGVTKQFIFRDFFAGRPDLCYIIGVSTLVLEILLSICLFIRKTRLIFIIWGIIFHIELVVTLHVPTIFFFLFPPQLLLFIDPKKILQWVEERREKNKEKIKQARFVYDGKCGFCQASLKDLLIMDMFGIMEPVDYQIFVNPSEIHPQLNKEICHSQIHLITPQGKIYGGFFAFRKLSLQLPMLYPFIPFLYLPGMGYLGPAVYRWVAKNRYLFHSSKTCNSNACFR